MLTLTNADIGELLRAPPPSEESIFHAALALKKLPEFETKTLAELASMACGELLHCREVARVEMRYYREYLERMRIDKVLQLLSEEEAAKFVTEESRSGRALDWFRRYCRAIERGEVVFFGSEKYELYAGSGWRKSTLEILKSKYPTWRESEISNVRAESRKKSKKSFA